MRIEKIVQNTFNSTLIFFYPLSIISFWMIPIQQEKPVISIVLLMAAMLSLAVNLNQRKSAKQTILASIFAIILISVCCFYGFVTSILSASEINGISNLYNSFIDKQVHLYPWFVISVLLSCLGLSASYKGLTRFFDLSDKVVIKISYLTSIVIAYTSLGVIS